MHAFCLRFLQTLNLCANCCASLFRDLTTEFICIDCTRKFHRCTLSIYIPRVRCSVHCSRPLLAWSTAWWGTQGKAANVSIVLCDIMAPPGYPNDSHHSSHNVQWPGTRLCLCGFYKGRIKLMQNGLSFRNYKGETLNGKVYLVCLFWVSRWI